ncbi:hypothetical protein TSMG0077 [Halocynthia phage JM-2012]|uniref:hypothetical protein n=1 Tax=Halocynthia phage JM-2012 TaxID=1173297 RepID=UPI00025C6921|nr:hypothetical protein TSMG0077 [Halocynthia phage JM-2012]AFI55360.1 hypothetical protein TSMG0077 [Halocynthia phage JM-2012]
MKLSEQQRLIALANLVELGKRVLTNVVGDDLSTSIDGQSVEDNAEVLITTKLREKVILKG